MIDETLNLNAVGYYYLHLVPNHFTWVQVSESGSVIMKIESKKGKLILMMFVRTHWELEEFKSYALNKGLTLDWSVFDQVREALSEYNPYVGEEVWMIES